MQSSNRNYSFSARFSRILDSSELLCEVLEEDIVLTENIGKGYGRVSGNVLEVRGGEVVGLFHAGGLRKKSDNLQGVSQ